MVPYLPTLLITLCLPRLLTMGICNHMKGKKMVLTDSCMKMLPSTAPPVTSSMSFLLPCLSFMAVHSGTSSSSGVFPVPGLSHKSHLDLAALGLAASRQDVIKISG